MNFFSSGQPRNHWVKYDENMAARDMWAGDLLTAFKEEVRKVREAYSSPHNSPTHIYKDVDTAAAPQGGGQRLGPQGGGSQAGGVPVGGLSDVDRLQANKPQVRIQHQAIN